MSPSCVFVTGATGFIGTKLVNALVARGHTVHALSRASSNRDGLTHERIRLVPGDVMDPALLRRGMEDCQYVFHLAAYAKNWAKDPRVFFDQNIQGIRNVFTTAKEVGAKRVVFTSSIVTFGPTVPGILGDEQMPRLSQRYLCEYEESKALAEREATRLAAKGFPIVIVNPTRAFGPGKLTEGNSMSLLIDRYDRGKLPVLLNGGKNVGNYVLVDDLVE
jgi:farnesol dehydrogenase